MWPRGVDSRLPVRLQISDYEIAPYCSVNGSEVVRYLLFFQEVLEYLAINTPDEAVGDSLPSQLVYNSGDIDSFATRVSAQAGPPIGLLYHQSLYGNRLVQARIQSHCCNHLDSFHFQQVGAAGHADRHAAGDDYQVAVVSQSSLLGHCGSSREQVSYS